MAYGGEYAKELLALPIHPSLLKPKLKILCGRSLKDLFDGVAFWRRLSDCELESVQNGNASVLLAADDESSRMKVEIDGKFVEFKGRIKRVCDTPDDVFKNNAKWYYVLIEQLTPEQLEALKPFCQCGDCHPGLFSRANLSCVKNSPASFTAIRNARKARQTALSGYRCSIL